ncbi:hypothetical protein BKI52_05505 [marine bacterium AO1-C]|nr:hypothetical protein BKI52_05505 [marine bacterium AO1-C]
MKLSILLPFYNAEDTLKAAIESILSQTYTNFELILVNNASTDQSRLIAQKFAKQDSRITIVDEARQGIVYALNTGLSHSKASYIARMDADDMALSTRLQKQVTFLDAHPDIDLVSCLVDYQSASEGTLGYQKYVEWINTLVTPEQIALNRFVESPLAHPSVMFRRAAVEQWGRYRQGNFPEDYELWLRWLQAGAQMAKVTEPLLVWNDAPTRLSRNDVRYSPKEFYQTKAHYLAEWLKEKNAYYPKVWIWGAGKLSRKRARMLPPLGIQIEGFFDVETHQRLDVSCLHFSEIPPPGKIFIISYVGNWGARDEIRQYLLNLDYQEGVDFILAS